MTPAQKAIATRLANITPANVKEGVFIDQLPNWSERPMTEKGQAYLLRLLDRYAHQIPDAADLKQQHLDEQLGAIE